MPLLSVVPALVPHVVSLLLICVSLCSGFALGCSLPPCQYSQCAPALVPHVVSVLLVCVRSCSEFAFAFWVFHDTVPLLSVCSCFEFLCYERSPHLCELLLWVCSCSLPPCLYSQCAPSLVPCATSVLLIFVNSCSGFALGY
jgi:hypothetical protein